MSQAALLLKTQDVMMISDTERRRVKQRFEFGGTLEGAIPLDDGSAINTREIVMVINDIATFNARSLSVQIVTPESAPEPAVPEPAELEPEPEPEPIPAPEPEPEAAPEGKGGGKGKGKNKK